MERLLEMGQGDGPAVVKVGDQTIALSTLEYWTNVGTMGREAPVPPMFDRCVERRRRGGGSRGNEAVEKLRSRCAAMYRQARRRALDFVISAEWLIGEARSLSLHVDEQAVEEEFEQSRRDFFPTRTELQAHVRATGETTSDIMMNLRLGQLSDKIYKHVAKSEASVSAADVERYYRMKRSRFEVPEERDLEIVRLETETAARRAERVIASGVPFSRVAKGLKTQPSFVKNAAVRGLTPKAISDTGLDSAVFSSPPNAVIGPIHSATGYYVLEVTAIRPPVRRPLREAERTIRAELSAELHRRHLAAFARRYKVSWTARTSCQPGYVVHRCREFKGPLLTPGEDPYTF